MDLNFGSEPLLDLDLLKHVSDPTEVGELLNGRPEALANVAETLREQISEITALKVDRADYSTADLVLDVAVAGLQNRLSNALALAEERNLELEVLSTTLKQLGALIDSYWTVGGTLTAARDILTSSARDTQGEIVDEEGENPLAITASTLSEEIVPLLVTRSAQAQRVFMEISQRASDVAKFCGDSEQAVKDYAILLQSQRAVLEARQLAAPNPIIQQEIDKIIGAEKSVSALAQTLAEENERTTQRVNDMRRARQALLDSLNPLKMLEDVFTAAGTAIADAGRAINKGAVKLGKALEQGVRDAGHAIDEGWRHFWNEVTVVANNIGREILEGICRLQHGSPDRTDKDHDGDGINDSYLKCMNEESWGVAVAVDEEGNTTGIGADLPGVPGGVLWVQLVTDEDVRREEARIEAERQYIRDVNAAVTNEFQPDPLMDQALADLFNANPDQFLRPFGEPQVQLLKDHPSTDPAPYTDILGNTWTNKREFQIVLAKEELADIDAMLTELDEMPLDRNRMMLAQIVAAHVYSFELTFALAGAATSGALIALGTAKDIISGEPVMINFLLRKKNIPYLDLYGSWIALNSIESDHADAVRSRREAKEKLENMKKLVRDKIEDLEKTK